MARNGYPDDPNNYSEGDPTQYANYGGTGGQAYSEYAESGYDQPPTGYQPQTGYGSYPAPEPPGPSWHQRPAVLVGLGVLTAALLALLVYAIVSFTNAGSSTTPAVSSTSTTAPTSSAPSTSAAPPPPAPNTQTAAPSSSEAPAPTTVTTTVTPTTTAPPTTSEAPSPTTVTSVTTSVTTVTETTTKPLWPTIPKPTPRSPTLMEPPPSG